MGYGFLGSWITEICFTRGPWASGGQAHHFIPTLTPLTPASPCLVVRGAANNGKH